MYCAVAVDVYYCSLPLLPTSLLQLLIFCRFHPTFAIWSKFGQYSIAYTASACLNYLNPLRPQRLIRIWVGRSCQRHQVLPPFVLHNSSTSFVFCLYVFVMLNVFETPPTCLHWFGFNCVGSPGFERRIWTREVLLCRFVCYTHVPFLYNRFSVHV